MTDAPVCHIPGTEIIDQPNGRLLPNIPVATDLESALRAIRALTQTVKLMSGQLRPGSQSRTPNFNPGLPYRGGNDPGKGAKGNDGGSGPGGGFKTQNNDGPWEEVRQKRVTKTVKIPIGDSDEDFVEVKRINEIHMLDKRTKDTWTWKRGE